MPAPEPWMRARTRRSARPSTRYRSSHRIFSTECIQATVKSGAGMTARSAPAMKRHAPFTIGVRRAP